MKAILVMLAVFAPLIGIGGGIGGVLVSMTPTVLALGALYIGTVLEEKLGTPPQHAQRPIPAPPAWGDTRSNYPGGAP